MNRYKLLSIIVICSILLYSAISYSEFGAPAKFGNATATTCYVGGDNGIINCTGPVTTGDVTLNKTGALSKNMSYISLDANGDIGVWI